MIEIEQNWLPLAVLATAMVVVHLFFPILDRLMHARESFWMGLIGGIATGYVVLYLMPKLARITVGTIGMDPLAELEFNDLWVYMLLLAGIVSYLVMLHLDESLAPSAAMHFDTLAHGAYSFLVGYVFVEMSSDFVEINVAMAVILSLHLLGMDHLFRHSWPAQFDHKGRWAFALLLLTGAGAGFLTELSKTAINAITAFLAGVILVNVISEELPLNHQRRVPFYLLGLALFMLFAFTVLTVDERMAYPAY
ncbi:MAG: hypothetical protein AAGE43_14625 [Pseudomonadota bacterium]